MRTRPRRRPEPRPERRTRCRLFAFLDRDGRWVATCRTHGRLGAGTDVYADWLAAIHAGNHPA